MAGQTKITRTGKGSALTHAELDGSILNGIAQGNSQSSANGGGGGYNTTYYNVTIPSGATQGMCKISGTRGERPGGPIYFQFNNTDVTSVPAPASSTTTYTFLFDLTKGSVSNMTVGNVHTINAAVNSIRIGVRHLSSRGGTNGSWTFSFA